MTDVPDIGKCDTCGSEDGIRRRVRWQGVWAWLCRDCRDFYIREGLRRAAG